MDKVPISNSAVDKAGKIVSGRIESVNNEKEKAFDIIDNWRTAHNFPLNSFYSLLLERAKIVDPETIVVQRIKRLDSIIKKLQRFSTIKLSQIQDIGGCRAIMKNVSQVEKLTDGYINGNNIYHIFVKQYDYIRFPKNDGYRGIHLVYGYLNESLPEYNGLKIEIQIRTRLQHAWATAVETVSTFTKQALKSGQGDEKWFRFFALMGSAMSVKEVMPIVPNTPESIYELKGEIIKYTKLLDVESRLEAYRDSLKVIDEEIFPDTHYYLMELDMNNIEKKIEIKQYRQYEFIEASEEYMKLERRNLGKNVDVVLVSAESLQSLKTAYPNYYLDTDMFLQSVKDIIE